MGQAKTWNPWTPKQDELLRELIAQRLTDRAIVEQFARRGVPRTIHSVRERIKALSLPIQSDRMVWQDIGDAPAEQVAEPIELPPPPPDPIEVERERQERIRNLRAEREALKDIASERSLRATLEKLFTDLVPSLEAPPAFVPRVVKGAKPTRESLLLHLSDWHYGETVDASGTRALNEYNTSIAQRRIKTVFDGALGIAEKMRAGGGWEFPRMVVAVNGDMVTGTIHELERHGDHMNVIWSVYYCAMELAEQLRRLAAEFPEVDVFVTSGNHGRLPDARKMQSKDPTRNWDTLVGLIARTALENVPNVTVTIPNSYAVTYEVEGNVVLQSHGHDVKSWGGIPWYGINRIVTNYNALEASRGGRISAYLFGHFHSATNLTYPGGEAFVNGSLIGGTEWTVNALGKADRPCQMMLGFHPDHGVTHRWPIYAEEL
jgi:hypothetical protein